MKQQTTNLPNLTALRGIAALFIVVFHFDELVLHLSFTEDNLFLHHGYLMVDLFFILSGFIIFHVYGENFSKGIKKENFSTFIRARFARIYPLHLFLLLVFILIIYGSFNPYMSGTLKDLIHDPKAIVTNLLLLQSFGIHGIFTWNLPSWSISAEWWAYLIFPFLALLLTRHKSYTLLLMVAVVISLYVTIAYYLPRSKFLWNIPGITNINVTFDYGYLRGLAGFMAGMITYELFQIKRLAQFFSRDSVAWGSIISIIVLLTIGFNNLIFIPLFMMLVLSAACNKYSFHKFCTLGPLQFLGKISYSVYMVHYLLLVCVAIPLLDVVGFNYLGPGSVNPPLTQGMVMCALFLLVVILVSSLSYDFLENPFRKWINRRNVN